MPRDEASITHSNKRLIQAEGKTILIIVGDKNKKNVLNCFFVLIQGAFISLVLLNHVILISFVHLSTFEAAMPHECYINTM